MKFFDTRIFILLLFQFLIFGFLQSQNITLSSQVEVDTFNFTEVNNLTISGEDISNLNGLSELVQVNGNLLITSNSNLMTFRLENLRIVEGYLHILNHNFLERFNFPSLERVGSQAFEDNNSIFTPFDGDPVHTLLIQGNEG